MKSNIQKVVLVVLVAIATMPLFAQDCMNIFFKDGSWRKFYLKDITEISTSKYDAEGNSFGDYDFQLISTTSNNKYYYYLEDIDSITFKEYDEEQAEENFISAMPKIISKMSDCETIEDAEDKIDEIKAIDGIQEAWSDGHMIHVQLEEGEQISFHINHDSFTRNTDSGQSHMFYPQKTYTLQNEENSLKAIIANQQHADEDRDYNTFFDLAIGSLAKCGVDAKYLASPTVDFFYDNSDDPSNPHLYDCDIVLLSTHGGYDNIIYKGISHWYENDYWFLGEKAHSIMTSEVLATAESASANAEDVPIWTTKYKALKKWRDNVAYENATDQHITFSFSHEKRNGKWYWVAHPMLTEFFFRDIARGRFKNPNSLLINASCQSLMGEEGLMSNSFAKTLFELGLGVYAGYTDTNRFGQLAGVTMISGLAKGYSIEKTEALLPDFLRKESLENILNSKYFTDAEKDSFRIKGTKNAELKILSWDGKHKSDYFLLQNSTAKKNEQQAQKEYNVSKSVTIEGATKFPELGEDIEVGFKYGLNPRTQFQDKKIEKNNIKSDNNGNYVFNMTIDGLTPGYTYYYKAYTYDGSHYNYGNTESFTIEKPEAHDYVDLGLPSGTLWATCNVGAETSLDRGKYFSWGETEQKYYYDWWEYQYCEGGYNNMTKYCTDSQFGTVDGLKELMPEDDAATVNWGADWRTPSYEQVRELTNSCYTTKHAIEKDGVEGVEFISKINGNTLFFPYNGYARKGELNSYSSGVYCWSRSLYTSWVSKGYVLTSSSTYAFDRKDGLGVRPVRVKEDNHEYVDLGLPSGTLWATCNIGANSPEETGIYVAWGETQPKSSGYEWSVYSHCINYEYNLTKYCIDSDLAYQGQEEIDNLKELLPEDDAATTNWGENWQMPSLAQVEELLDNRYTTTKDWSLNGVKGRLITSNKNGKWIFIPYTGYVSGGSVYSADSYGYLWSRSLDLERECYYARSWRVSTNDVGPDHGSRCLGENVRAVRKKK